MAAHFIEAHGIGNVPLMKTTTLMPRNIPLPRKLWCGLFEWQHELSDICDREPNETIVGIYCKLQIYAIRFCLIIQMARWACNDAGKDMIDLISVERAISLAEYFKESRKGTDNSKRVVAHCPAVGHRLRIAPRI